MTNIAYKDVAGGAIHVYSAHSDLPKWERIQKALQDLKHMGNIKIYLFKRNKLRLINRKAF